MKAHFLAVILAAVLATVVVHLSEGISCYYCSNFQTNNCVYVDNTTQVVACNVTMPQCYTKNTVGVVNRGCAPSDWTTSCSVLNATCTTVCNSGDKCNSLSASAGSFGASALTAIFAFVSAVLVQAVYRR